MALQGHSKVTPRVLEHSKGTRARHSRQLGTWALDHLRHSGTRRALGHSGTQGTWALVALETLYLADSFTSKPTVKFIVSLNSKVFIESSVKLRNI